MMKTNIKTQIADYKNLNHARAIIELMRGYSSDIMGGGEPLPEAVLSNLPSALALRNDAYTIIAWHNDYPVGLLNGFEGFSTFKCQALFNIHDLYVHADFRQYGVAKTLLLDVEKMAAQKQWCKLTLEVLEGNQPARALYNKAGFKSYTLLEETGHALFLEKNLT